MSEPSVIIRKFNPNDLEQLMELMREYTRFNNEQGSIPPELAPFEAENDQEKEWLKYATEIVNGPEYFGLCAEDDRMVGFIVGSMKQRDGYKLDYEGYVEDFFVTESKRGQGIGTKLFEELVKEFKKRGATHLALDAYAANQPAIDLYHQWGFIDSELVMRRKLDA